MKTKRISVYLINIVLFYLFFFPFKISAADKLEVNIEVYPEATAIAYGEPLFESDLVGGRADVEGHFYFKEELKVLSWGSHQERVVFIPVDSNYEEKEFYVNVMVNKREIRINFEKNIFKQYDEKNSIKLPNYTVENIIKGEEVYIRGELEGTLETIFVGERTKVNLSGIEIIGRQKDNYCLNMDGVYATIYPSYIEKLGEVKDRIDFVGGSYVPINSLLEVKEDDSRFTHKGYDIKKAYEVNLSSSGIKVDIKEKVLVKIKMDEDDLNKKRLEIFNLYEGEYEKIEYEYKEGYLIYISNGLGKIIIAQKKINLSWLYWVLLMAFIIMSIIVIKRRIENSKKIYRYKSIKRRKKNENYC